MEMDFWILPILCFTSTAQSHVNLSALHQNALNLTIIGKPSPHQKSIVARLAADPAISQDKMERLQPVTDADPSIWCIALR